MIGESIRTMSNLTIYGKIWQEHVHSEEKGFYLKFPFSSKYTGFVQLSTQNFHTDTHTKFNHFQNIEDS